MDARLVGRQKELRRLFRLLTEPDRRAAVLAGPAGVGKSRLADELTTAAQVGGRSVVRARGSRAAATMPLGAFAHVLPDDPGRASTRIELLQGLVSHLTRLAEGTRLLVVVDDAHQLDDASATLVYLLATTSTVTTLLTVRAEEPSSDPIAALWLDGHADRIELTPLERREADELVEVLLDGPVARATLAELWRMTRGNPLLTVETVRGARESGVLQTAGGMWHHTGGLGHAERLAAVINSRLDHLDEGDLAALEVLAVGEPVPLQVMERAVVPERITALERRGLVEVTTDDERPSVRTLHPLYGEVLRDRMPRTQVRAAARQLAAALTELGSPRRADSFRLALWQLETGDTSDPDALTDAARHALQLLDHELAERLARAAIEGGHTGAARLALAESLAGLGRAHEAEREFAAIDAAYLASRPAAIAEPRAWNLALNLDKVAAAMEVLHRAVAEAGDDVEAVDQILSVEATLRSFLGDLDGALETSRRILDRSDASDRTVLQALTIHTVAVVLRGAPVTAMPDIDRGLALGARLGDAVPMAATKLRLTRALALDMQGGFREADQAAHADYLDALERGEHHTFGAYGTIYSQVLLARGRIAESVSVSAEALLALERMDPLDLGASCLAVRALGLAQSGDLTGAVATLEEHDRRHPGRHRFSAQTARARAWVRAQQGDLAAAVALARAAGLELRAAGLPGWAAGLLHDVVRYGEAAVVADDLAELAREVEGPFVTALAAHAAAAAGGRAADLEAAALALGDLGADLLGAEAFASAATAYLREGSEEAARRADRRCQRLARGCLGARTPGLIEPPAALTPRQNEVAHLATSGLTNREIGARLHISSRTVDNHLAQIYAKLGIRGRGQLPAALRAEDPDTQGRDPVPT